MKEQAGTFGLFVIALVFIGMPMLFYTTGDFPRRTYLKESLSILTIVAFFMMLAQFFLTRSTNMLLSGNKFSAVLKIHKVVGYVFVTVLLVHPFMIVVPRFFESGVDGMEAFVIIITSFDSLGVVLGIISWCLMLILAALCLLRNTLPLTYKTWRKAHGLLSILFIVMASWHAINLGRHIDQFLSFYMLALQVTGVFFMLKSYIVTSPLAAEMLK